MERLRKDMMFGPALLGVIFVVGFLMGQNHTLKEKVKACSREIDAANLLLADANQQLKDAKDMTGSSDFVMTYTLKNLNPSYQPRPNPCSSEK